MGVCFLTSPESCEEFILPTVSFPISRRIYITVSFLLSLFLTTQKPYPTNIFPEIGGKTLLRPTSLLIV